MATALDTGSARPADPGELRVLIARLRPPEERPVPLEDDPFVPVDGEYDAHVEDHLERHLGPSEDRACDTEGPFAIDVVQVPPPRHRSWGALFTVGAGMAAVPGEDAPGAPAAIRRFELIARLPASSFRRVDEFMLEPFDDLRDAAIDALGELARLPHLRGVCYAPPQIVATPDLTPLAHGLPFAGALIRDARHAKFGLRRFARPGPAPIEVPGYGTVTFLTVTLLHASEVCALMGPDRGEATRRLEAAGADELVDPGRRPVV